MVPDRSQSIVVTMQKWSGEGVASATVQILILSVQRAVEPHFSEEYKERGAGPPLSMLPECAAHYKSVHDLRIGCELSVVSALQHFQQVYPKPLDCTIQAIEGSSLPSDGTYGFYLAATIAAMRATNFSSDIATDLCGWEEVS